MYRSAFYRESLLNELSVTKKERAEALKGIPISIQRKEKIDLPDLDETQVVRHFHRLSQMNYGIDSGIYPLGSCTMKYNPKLCEEIAGWDRFIGTHPYQDSSTIQGNLELMFELERLLCNITGMDYFSLQPAAGAQGEFLGMLLTRAYHDSNNEEQRKEVIIPDTAHGTNPASATMAGYKLTEISSTKDGTVDLDLLEKTLSDKTACFMLTNPNTLGIFESEILEISKLVHDSGALLYYDGANINAIMGKARPRDMGFDIVHLNLHKTFATPHGGGGPGSGPVGVKTKLEKFLPIPRIIKKDGKYLFDYDAEYSIGKIKGYYGNFSVLLKAYIYILMMGKEGLKEASEIAVLNSNYMKEKILDSKNYEMPYKKLRKHEFVLS
ncbi:MAG: aminomethyl-transferring glycine dehydrogenase subunit GcvPB, partial [Thermoplasmatales archaeon]